MNEPIFPQTLPVNTTKLTELLTQKNPSFLREFYLSGGTALALQIGHRQSEDLDFFCAQVFAPSKLEQELLALGSLQNTQLAPGTLNSYLNGVKLQFLHYPYPLLKTNESWNNISLSSVADIACTKMQTVAARGNKKDFIDLYFLLQHYSLTELFELLSKKYTDTNYDQTHILKSLAYFADAEDQPMPRMIKPISWEEVKSGLITQIKHFQF